MYIEVLIIQDFENETIQHILVSKKGKMVSQIMEEFPNQRTTPFVKALKKYVSDRSPHPLEPKTSHLNEVGYVNYVEVLLWDK